MEGTTDTTGHKCSSANNKRNEGSPKSLGLPFNVLHSQIFALSGTLEQT